MNIAKNKYLNHFFSLNCSRDLIPFFTGCQRNSAKEVTESFSCFYAAKKLIGEEVMESDSINDYHIVVVGDGALPRTGATFSFLTKATVTSVDPIFNRNKLQSIEDWLTFPVNGLEVIKDKIENIKVNCRGKDTLLVMPHSHAKLDLSIAALTNYGKLGVVTMPCCVKIPEKFKKLAQKYTDENVWSPKNKIYLKWV